MILARKNIQEAIPYVGGKPIEETKRELGLKDVIKLASNENPLGPSPKALKAIISAAKHVNRYPDSNSFYLKNKLSQSCGLSPENFVIGNGSDELIEVIMQTFVEDDENIVTSDTSFLEYEIIAKALNLEIRKSPLKNFRYDLSGLRKLIDSKTKLVFIANPNNPTGTYINKAELESFLSSLPENVITVMDEAYDVFIDVKDYPFGSDYIGKKNIIVLKTFSKAYGLAGLRVGYAVSDKVLSRYIEKARQPFNVNILAQEAALAALDDENFLKRTRQVVLKGKKYLYEKLDRLKLKYVSSVTNFILVDVGKDCVSVFKDLLKEGVIVRDMKQYGLNNFIRVTIGTQTENEKFIMALKRVMQTQNPR